MKVLFRTIAFPVFLPPKLVTPSYKNFTSIVSAALQTERKASTKLNASSTLGRVLYKLLSVRFCVSSAHKLIDIPFVITEEVIVHPVHGDGYLMSDILTFGLNHTC